MGFRFRRTVSIAPGVRLNFGKKGASVRFGGRGLGVTTGTSGTRASAGIPGTGLYTTQKLGSSERRSSSPRTTTTTGSKAGPQATHMTLREAVRHIGPKEGGLEFPTWWLSGAVLGLIMIPATSGGSLLLAAACAVPVWRRVKSPKYEALQTVRSAQNGAEEGLDQSVRDAAGMASSSWTVQREAGLYFSQRKLFRETMHYLAEATRLFPGDRRTYLALTADAAIDADQPEYVITLLEPYLVTGDPKNDDLDAILVSTLALAVHRRGDSGRALEIVNRLPLRRRNLGQPLLLGLCVRAMAKQALGKKADAKRDLDRVYAADPTFSLIKEVEEAISG